MRQHLPSVLDESLNPVGKLSKHIKKKHTAHRRRTKSTGNIVDNTVVSSSSEKDMYQFLENAELNVQQNVPVGLREPHENSKNMQVGNTFAVPSMLFPMLSPPCMNSNRIAPNMAESDSLNETVSPLRPHTRRKRRFKRMAVDPEPPVQIDMTESGDSQLSSVLSQQKTFSFSSFASSSIFAKPRQRKIKKKATTINKLPNVTIGKRKRSVRERSIECELEKISLNSSPETDKAADLSATNGIDNILNKGLMNDSMDLGMKQMDQVSSSSVSGSESDPGFYTHDDGREADDEQSDWYQESGPSWEAAGMKPWWERDHDFPFRASADEDLETEETEDEGTSDEKKFRQLLKGSWHHLSDEAKNAYQLRMQKLRDRIPGREMRAGRRHLGAQRGPSFSILTSANEKLSRFLQDPAQSELRLHPMQKSERDQLSHLASLYSLQMMSEGARGLKCPVLKKTSNTMQAVQIDMDRSPSLWTHFKRQRKTPPASVTSEDAVDEPCAIDKSNIGNQILNRMGWTPGTGLGSRGQGITSPVLARMRPKYLGLGHGKNTEGDQK